ncbi:MAG: ferrous iron transport protein B [Ignavibacteriales bacterium]|nr:ferrous iron transport protein B [Ignavibacteriales bacterium]
MTEDLRDRVPHLEKHRHTELGFLQTDLRIPKAVLVGNPNVGKSLVFNAISGLYIDVSNYPGTTVEVEKGKFRGFEVYDTPGIYGVSSFNDEERVARDIILNADIVLNVIDGTHMERDLFLTQHLIDMGKKVTVLLNFMDEVKKHEIRIDIDKLSNFLGVEIIPLIASQKIDLDLMEKAMRSAREGVQRRELHSSLHTMLSMVGSQAEALLVLEGDEVVATRHGIKPAAQRDALYVERRNRVNYILNQVLNDSRPRRRFPDLLGRWTVNPITGIPILIVALYISYLFVGKLVAQDFVGFTEGEIGKNLWEPWIQGLVGELIPLSSWIGTLLVGPYGAVTMTTTYLVFLLLPLVAAFYLTLSVLEDSGYLPRLATMVDRGLSALGLNGRAVIPLILGFGCITSATITTRLLNTEREKTIATAILQFAIPCSAQIAVIVALLAGAGFAPMLIYAAVLLSVLIALGTILNRMLKGSPEPLLLDLPPLRMPKFTNVVRKSFVRSTEFMKEAAAWFFVGALSVAIADLVGLLEFFQKLLIPVTTSWLQLPPEAATAFIMGVVRRDFGAAGLYDMDLAPMQVLVALITITLFVPCIASLMVMMKERGLKEGLTIWGGTWVIAFLVGGIVSQVVL